MKKLYANINRSTGATLLFCVALSCCKKKIDDEPLAANCDKEIFLPKNILLRVTGPRSETLNPPPILRLLSYVYYSDGGDFELLSKTVVLTALPYKDYVDGADPREDEKFRNLRWEGTLTYPDGVAPPLKIIAQEATNNCSEVNWVFVLGDS